MYVCKQMAEETKITKPSNGADQTTCNKCSQDGESSVKDCDQCQPVPKQLSSDTVNSPSEPDVLQSYKQKAWYQKFVIVLDSEDEDGSDKECSDCDSGYNECDEENTEKTSDSKPNSLPSSIDPKELEALEELFKNTDWMGSGLKQSCEQ
ncbi:uncharacterized protein LOC106881665 isoform X1 [Octopus bimaculoides]|nr:uncharacterized protein LOC106881665 isoform X1 [Octopus bimaculoides]